MTARAAKMEATRRRILDCAADLYMRRSIDDFTLEEVAHCAGATVQTILRIHGSRDRLLLAALDKLVQIGVPLKPTPPGDIDAAVGAIFDLYEATGEVILKELADEHRRPELKKMLDEGRAHHRDWVQLAFAPQLAACPSAAARMLLLNALIVATDITVWAKLRKDNALARPQAEAVVRRIIESVVEREDRHGEASVAELVGRRKSSA
ncbi:MAG TPA: TetR/AcrR family transcriptional regulator [Roseiarcus sp.]|nr:TetR/AcrR family transcriptional regulator [Roseiarcus sp.]